MSNIPQKYCPGCKKEWDATNKFFGNDKWAPDKLTSRCKTCRSKQAKKTRETYPQKKMVYHYDPDLVVYKKCSQCKQPKLVNLENFYTANEKYGVSLVCRVCHPAYIARLAQARLERDQAKGKRECTVCHKEFPPTPAYFHRDGSGGLHPQCKSCRGLTVVAYRETHREETCQSTKNWRENHLEYRQAYSKNYIRTHREQNRVYSHNRRAREKEVPGTHTPEQVQDQLERQKYRCYYADCGFSKFKKVKGEYVFTVEHTFPITRAAGMNIPANGMDYLVLCCKSCNSKKGNKLPHEWAAGGRLL